MLRLFFNNCIEVFVRFSKIKLMTEQSVQIQNSMTHRSNWRLGVLATAIALLGSFSHFPVYALGLGRITIQSALGEALRAEIDIAQITPEEAGSLRVGVAAPAAFKAAGLEYSQAVSGLQISLQKRADGRSFLILSSNRPMTEPFVDLILEASWSSGRLVRDYTMLFDPPNLRQAAAPASVMPIAPTAPQLTRPAASNIPPAPPALSSRNDLPAVVKAPPQKQPSTPKVVAGERASRPRPAVTSQQVTVKPGNTASKIAAQNKPASISLDQMLVALLKSNPDAFIGGNINRLKSGAVLNIPAAGDADAVPGPEASRTIAAQAKDFNDFRQKLASGVPTTRVESANRQSGGKVQADVQDRAAVAVAPDKLTLSKGALQGQAAAEEKIARDKQANDASARVAELSKNIGDLNKVAGLSGTAVAPPAAPAVGASASKAVGLPIDRPVALPASPVVPSTGVTATSTGAATGAAIGAVASGTPGGSKTLSVLPATAPALAEAQLPAAAVAPAALTASGSLAAASVSVATPSSNAVAAGTPAASAPVAVKKPDTAVLPAVEPGFIEELTSSEYILPALAALLALLAGFGLYRYKKRDRGTAVDSSFLESRLQPDSFFGASGGQRIDTNESITATGSSLVYSPSQMDAAGDVDPVAEADVYLAYGRDLQAEEILKEALRTNPTRVAIHAKLLEIYAKRRDLKAFEAVAAKALTLTQGSGPEWEHICEMGRDVDSSNPLYQQGGQPLQAAPQTAILTPAMQASLGADTIPLMTVVPTSARGTAPDLDVDFDLDLDFSDGQALASATPNSTNTTGQFISANEAPVIGAKSAVAPKVTREPDFAGLDMDFEAITPAFADAKKQNDNIPDFDLTTPLTATYPVVSADKAVALPAQLLPAADNGMLEFDLGSLSLDLDTPASSSLSPAKNEPVLVEGPLEIKFALAEEFRALGDNDGARSLASEVVAQGQGALKTKAQAFLNALS